MKLRPAASLFAVTVVAACAQPVRAQTWSSFNYPGAINTQARGISGNNIVGDYYTSFNPTIEHGYLYNGSTFISFDDPLAGTFNGQGTIATGIAASGNIVGYYLDASNVNHGFLKIGNSYQTVNYPGLINDTFVYGISSTTGKIVGNYADTSNNHHGFVLSGSTYTPLNDPNASAANNQGTFAQGISNTTGEIVGYYIDVSNKIHGFLYNGGYTTLDYPGAKHTYVFGIDGNNIVGAYFDSNDGDHAFIYNNGTWTSLDYPGFFEGTDAFAIDGNSIVGNINPEFQSGFLLTVPEPPGLPLAALGCLGLAASFCTRWPRRS